MNGSLILRRLVAKQKILPKKKIKKQFKISDRLRLERHTLVNCNFPFVNLKQYKAKRHRTEQQKEIACLNKSKLNTVFIVVSQCLN